jgi:predicted TIM-barrel fold metal-dependent hydrolase
MLEADLRKLRPISADSHVTEPPDCYSLRLESKFRDRAPYLVNDPVKGAQFVIEGMTPIRIGSLAAAGVPASEIKKQQARSFDMLHRGGWDPKARIADMERDGVAAEVIYPSVGMAVFFTPDIELAAACCRAYNLWLEEYCSAVPDRLFGIGQSAAVSPQELIEDIRRIKAQGLRGVMLPLEPGVSDFDDPMYDEAWAAAAEFDLPLSFHVLPRTKTGAETSLQKARGGKLANILSITRLNQEVINTFVLGGVFERIPSLKLICVEADAGWVPHYAHRMDHGWERFRTMLDSEGLQRPPSTYILNNVYFTFQDDRIALQAAHLMNSKRLLWASDFPHNDSTWPDSLSLLERHTEGVPDETVTDIVRNNVVELYGLPVAA